MSGTDPRDAVNRPPEVRGLEAGIVSPAADALAAFYRQAFGFEDVARFEFPQGIVVRLRAGRGELKLYQPANPPRRMPPPDPWHRDAGFAYAALHVTDAEAAHRCAVEHGGRSLTEPVSHRPGARFALVADPEGNVWELLEES